MMGDEFDTLLSECGNKITQVDLEISGNPRALALVRRILCSSAATHPIAPTVMSDIKLAVTEACTNVIKHAFRFDQTRKFGLNIQVSPRFFLIQVVYVDQAFDPDRIPIPDLKNIQEGGLGVFIIRNIMDQVAYETDAKTGTVRLKMLKFFDAKTSPGGTGED
jgi:serine/threonine-protein kinase RsbW